LVYGIEIYSNTHTKNINKLVILIDKILRILQNVSRDTHTVELYTKFNTFSIPALHNCQIVELVHKFTYHHDRLPAIFSIYFNTRTKDSLHVYLFASSLGQRSIKCKGSTLWNTLPEEIKTITSDVSFFNKLNKILL